MGHLVHIYSKTRPTTNLVHQSVLDNGLLERTFYSGEFPKTRFKKISKLATKLLLNSLNKNTAVLLKSLFGNKSQLSIYDFIPFLGKPQYDIIHAHFGVNGNLVTQLRKLGLFKKAKFITTFHGYDLNEAFFKSNFYTELFKDCNIYTVNSLFSKKKLIKLGVEEKKITLLPVGLDINKFIEEKKSLNAINLNLVFIGRLIEFKAPDLVIEIAEILKQRNNFLFSIQIVGHGDLQPILKEMIKAKKLEDQVILLGPRTQEEIISIFNDADIFLYPGITFQNRAENQGLVIQEAQAMQLPVIISDAGGMKEGIINGTTGFVVKENDLNGFVEKIELLANDKRLRDKMGAAGRKFVADNFDIQKLNEKLLQIYLN